MLKVVVLTISQGLLKKFLRDIPTPLLTYELYTQFLNVTSLNSKEEQILTLKKLISELPKLNMNMLRMLLTLLHKIQLHSTKNKMNSQNLAIVFGVGILRDKNATVQSVIQDNSKITRVCEMLIDFVHQLF